MNDLTDFDDIEIYCQSHHTELFSIHVYTPIPKIFIKKNFIPIKE